MPKVLFTHKIKAKHLEELSQAKFKFDSVSLIETKIKDFDVNDIDEAQTDAWIFTSKKAVKAISKNITHLTIPEYVFAVGSSTKKKLSEIGIGAITPVQFTSVHLVHKILEYPVRYCTYFHGNMTASDLSDELEEKGIKVNEVEVYETSFTSKKVNKKDYDAVVFLSPSAFTSFCELNDPKELKTVFCIGSTTAEAIKRSYKRLIITPDDFTFADLIKTINLKYKNVIS